MGVKFLIIALVYLAASSNANEIPGQTAASAASPGTDAVDGAAKPKTDATITSPSTVSPVSSDITSSSVTTTTGPSKNQTNPQVARDVTDCSTKFQELTRNSAFSPEKIILAGADGMKPDAFCDQQKKSAAVLNTACSVTDADKGVASVATGISNMINFFCDKASPKVLVDKDSKCDESVKTVTRGCLTKSGVTSTLTSSVIYPSDLLIMMMKESNSTVVCNTKNCISSEMQKGTCSADQQKTILASLDSFCAAGSETSTTTSPSDTSSATIPSASTTTPAGPASTTTKSGRSSASTIQTNLLIALLPVSVLFF